VTSRSSRPPKLAALVPIAEVASMMGIAKRRCARRLEALWASDLEKGHADWRFRVGSSDTGQILINLEALRVRHPALFERRYVSRAEVESIIDRLENVEAEQRRVRVDQRAVRRDFAELRDRVSSGHADTAH
jgi:hypothetical protein